MNIDVLGSAHVTRFAETKNNRAPECAIQRQRIATWRTQGAAQKRDWRGVQHIVVRYVHFYVHFYLLGVALHAFYTAVATFKIARCATRKAQIYFPPPHAAVLLGGLLRRLCYVLGDHMQTPHFPRLGYKLFSLFSFPFFSPNKNSAILETDNISRERGSVKACEYYFSTQDLPLSAHRCHKECFCNRSNAMNFWDILNIK